jgi:CHAT domain-containing protein/tetratricopeptide (TPR) repeat protein
MRNFSNIFICLTISALHAASIYSMNNPQASARDSIQILLKKGNDLINKGDYQKTLSAAKEIHRLRLSNYAPDDPRIINSFINLAYAFNLLTLYDSAQYYLDKAEYYYQVNHMPEGVEVGDLYSTMGLINQNRGNYLQAKEYYAHAEEIMTHQNDRFSIDDLIILYLRFAEVERLQENYQASLNYFQKALRLMQHVKNNENFLLNYYSGVALVYSKMNAHAESFEMQMKAINLAKIDSSRNSFRLALLYNNLGWDLLKTNQLESAHSYLMRSYQYYQTTGFKGTYYINNLESLGGLYNLEHNYPKALAYYQQALQLLSGDFNPKDNLSNPSEEKVFPSPQTLTVLKSKSICLNNYYNQELDIKYLNAAIQTALLAITVIEELRNTYQSYESKVEIAAHEYSIFKLSFQLLDKAFNKTHDKKYSQLAFTVSEKSKSAALLSSLREINAREFGNIPDSLLSKENILARDISLYKNKIYEETQETNPDNNKINTWKKYLFEAQQKHDQVIHLFESKYPTYYSLKYDKTVVNVNVLQRKIPANTTILEYVLNDSLLTVFAVSRNTFYMYSRNIDSSFYELLTDYMNEFHLFDFSRQSYTDFTKYCWNSKSLYDYLILPLSDYIRGKNLLIIPDAQLSYLPFETLIDQLPDEHTPNHFRDLNYLIYDYAISYAYSSTFYCQVNDQKNSRQGTRLLAFAPEYSPDLDINSYRTPYVTRQKFREELYPIPGVLEEVNAIKQLIPTDLYSGEKATESNFKRVAEKYDILHLAMHAVIDNKDPLFSKLIFTLEKDTFQDGLLNTYELFGMKLNARMVVLSACNTGEGDYSKGEGVISLARGFVYAGSPSLIMSMWEVEDKSGSMIMKWFYKNLLKGETKAEALRNAKIRYIQEARPENIHPFFWSSFVVMGNMQPLYKKDLPVFWIFLLSGILLISLSFIAYRRIKNTR